MNPEKKARYSLAIESIIELIEKDNEEQILKPILHYLKEQKTKLLAHNIAHIKVIEPQTIKP